MQVVLVLLVCWIGLTGSAVLSWSDGGGGVCPAK